MTLLTRIGDSVLDFSVRSQGWENPRASTIERLDFLPQAGDRKWIAVASLLKRSWFSRIWIVQEAVLATELVVACGSNTISWEVLRAATSLCFTEGLWGPNIERPIADQRTQKNILQLGNLRARSLTSGTFTPCDYMFNLLQLFHQKDVTIPRDRLFALLGMAKDGSEGRLRPRYDCSVEDLVVSYGSVFVDQGHGLDLLCQARLAWDGKGLPSWMPNLTAGTYPRTVTAWGERVGDEQFSAAGDEPRPNKGAVNDRVLCLQGCEVDEIARLGDYASNTDDVILFIEEILAFVDEVYDSMSEDERAEVKCRLPVGDTHKPETPSWDPEDRSGGTGYKSASRTDAYRNMLRYLDYRRGKTSKDEAVAIQEAGQADYIVSDVGLLRRRMWPYYRTVIEFSESFQPASAVVCETKKGRVGIVPQTACSATREKPGDKIIIFEGAKVPYIVRESDSTPGAYRAVGECYIDGIMHGELSRVAGRQAGFCVREFRLE